MNTVTEPLKRVRKKKKTTYKTQVWLNGLKSPSTGSIVCFRGPNPYSTSDDNIFIQLNDCSRSVRFSKETQDTLREYINKLKLIVSNLQKFIDYLERSLKEDNIG